MTDLVVGLGEIGMPLYQLLKNRNFKVDGYDMRLPEYSQLIEKDYDMVHICIPFYNEKQFDGAVIPYTRLTDNVVIHSTVPPGTSKRLGAIYSPIRGVHNNMYNHLNWFTKFYAAPNDSVDFKRRFPKCIRVDDTTKLETTKLTDLKYYGLLIAFTKFVNRTNPVYWEFMIEQDQMAGNRPIMYDDGNEIGGHCIRENIPMLGEDDISKFIEKWGGK